MAPGAQVCSEDQSPAVVESFLGLWRALAGGRPRKEWLRGEGGREEDQALRTAACLLVHAVVLCPVPLESKAWPPQTCPRHRLGPSEGEAGAWSVGATVAGVLCTGEDSPILSYSQNLCRVRLQALI